VFSVPPLFRRHTCYFAWVKSTCVLFVQVKAYLEVHIEQGPILESLDEPVGIVAGIAGQTRLYAVIKGEQVSIPRSLDVECFNMTSLQPYSCIQTSIYRVCVGAC